MRHRKEHLWHRHPACGSGFTGWKAVPHRCGLAIAGISLIVSSGCWRTEPREERPLDFLPPKADVIAVVEYGRFRQSQLFRRVFNDAEMKRIFQEIGISDDEVLRIAGFVEVNPSFLQREGPPREDESPGNFGVIVQGKKPLHAVFKALSEQGWVRRSRGAKPFWVAPDERPSLAAASLRGNMLVAGTSAAVEEVLDVAAGKRVAATGPRSGNESAAILRQMGLFGEINIALAFTEEMKLAAEEVARSAGVFGGMTGGMVVGGVLEALGSGRGVGLSFGEKDGGISSRVVFVAKDAAAAKVIAGLVTVAKIAAPAMAPFAPSEAVELIQSLKVRAENDAVLVDFAVSAEAFKNLER